MALGKAFIEVHADTAPFARELAASLDKIIKSVDKEVKVSANVVGKTIATETGKGIEKNKKQIGQGIDSALTDVTTTGGAFSKFAKGIVDTVDDGLSGLPAELKVIIGAAALAALPLIAGLTAALVAAITSSLALLGGAGIGALIAAQFTEVRNGFQETIGFVRDLFASSGEGLVRPFLNAFREIRERLGNLAPEFTRIFSTVELTIVPIIDALLGFVDEFTPGFRRGFSNILEFLAPLQIGLRAIGSAAGDFFEEILAHPDAPAALYDILILVEDLIRFFTGITESALRFYGIMRDIGEALGLVTEYDEEIQVLGKQFGIAAKEESLFGDATKGTLAPLEAQEKAVKDVNSALQTYIDQQFKLITNEISFERALDGLTESVKENGRSLKLSKEEGRQNAEGLLELARIALETRQNNIDMGLGVEFAEGKFQEQRTAIFDAAKELKLSKTATDRLVGALLNLPPPIATGVDEGSVQRLIAASLWASRLATRIAKLISIGAAQVVTAAGATPHAAGGVFTQPHVGLVAEAGPEAIIPLNNPGRAAQVMSQAGLTGAMSPTVNVYIGNTQIDAYIATQVNQQMTAAARAVSYGTRGI